MNILHQIIATKKAYVRQQKELYPIKKLEKSIHFSAPTVSLQDYLLRPESSGIIAEFKRKSPSQGFINQYANAEDITLGYMQSGATALSVLTDKRYFGGSHQDLTAARSVNFCPILRKDFIIDEYQIIEARSIGADVILLIASILTKHEITRFTDLAHRLGMEVLLEVKDESELKNSITKNTAIIGVNNRNLNTFKVDTETSEKLVASIPDEIIKISESGLDRPEDIIKLKKIGFKGFLIGTHFMQHAYPPKVCKDFIKEIQKKEKYDCTEN